MLFNIVLNSFHFFDDIMPETFRSMANPDTNPQGGNMAPENLLLETIEQGGHTILVTDRESRGNRLSIKREYAIEATSRGLGPQLAVVLDQLQNRGVVNVNTRLPRRQISGVGSHHRVFIEDAVAADVDYFVTEHEPWLNLDQDSDVCPNLRIVNSDRFMRIANRMES